MLMMKVIVVPPFVPCMMLKYLLFGGMITRSNCFPCYNMECSSWGDTLSPTCGEYTIPSNLLISSLASAALRVHIRISVVLSKPDEGWAVFIFWSSSLVHPIAFTLAGMSGWCKQWYRAMVEPPVATTLWHTSHHMESGNLEPPSIKRDRFFHLPLPLKQQSEQLRRFTLTSGSLYAKWQIPPQPSHFLFAAPAAIIAITPYVLPVCSRTNESVYKQLPRYFKRALLSKSPSSIAVVFTKSMGYSSVKMMPSTC